MCTKTSTWVFVVALFIKVKTAQMSITRRTNKRTVTFSYNGMFFSHKKAQTTSTQQHRWITKTLTWVTKARHERLHMYDFTYVKQAQIIYGDKNQDSSCLEVELGKGWAWTHRGCWKCLTSWSGWGLHMDADVSKLIRLCSSDLQVSLKANYSSV